MNDPFRSSLEGALAQIARLQAELAAVERARNIRRLEAELRELTGPDTKETWRQTYGSYALTVLGLLALAFGFHVAQTLLKFTFLQVVLEDIFLVAAYVGGSVLLTRKKRALESDRRDTEKRVRAELEELRKLPAVRVRVEAEEFATLESAQQHIEELEQRIAKESEA